MPTDETTLERLAAKWERDAEMWETAASRAAQAQSSDAPEIARRAADFRLIADALRFRLVGTGEAKLPAVRLAPQYDDATVAAFLEEAILQYSVDDAADSLLLDWAGIAAQRLATLADAPRMVTEEMVCPSCGSPRVKPTRGNAVGATMDCMVCGRDFTPAALSQPALAIVTPKPGPSLAESIEFYEAIVQDYKDGLEAMAEPLRESDLVDIHLRLGHYKHALKALRTQADGGFNGCYAEAVKALRYLALYPRPFGGEEQYNAQHLLQIAGELERSQV